ncbi:MAG: class I SAM-dependent methyltransferase [Candidatus Hodarchaeales archaeon]|jgi:ubiquinone/menaquinone biosynthesis C-methylase UbiE
MANWLTNSVNKFLSNEETVLDLCCGNGIVSDGFKFSKITGIDVCEEYLKDYQHKLPNSKTFVYDLSKISSSQEEIFNDNMFDNVLCIDGVEHLEKENGIALVERMERIASKRVIIFTPENANNPEIPVLNHPINKTSSKPVGSWGIGDHWQIHRSAFPRSFFQKRNYRVIQCNTARNVYDGTYYHEMLYILEK